MKTCQACGHANADEMRFCLECGKPLPDAPIVFNIGSSQSGQQPPQFNQPSGFGSQGFQQPSQFSMVPPPKPKSNKKIFIAIGGVLALFVLVFVGIAGIVAYNLMMKPDEPVVKNSPTPTASPKSSASESPTASATPKKSDVSTPREDDPVSNEPHASSSEIRADFDVRDGGKLGMKVYTTFTVYNMKGKEAYLALYFLDEDGEPLKTTNKKYSSTSGDVAVFYSIKPGYDEALYEDVALFIPYDEFRLSKGNYNLKVNASVIYKAGGIIAQLDEYPFKYEKY